MLHALPADPRADLYGLQIGDAAGLPSGTVHPILARLEGAGWVESRWEATRVLPRGEIRRRYQRELFAEMSAMPAARQLRYALGTLTTAWSLRNIAGGTAAFLGQGQSGGLGM